jgi:preprotein translocase subunit SecE
MAKASTANKTGKVKVAEKAGKPTKGKNAKPAKSSGKGSDNLGPWGRFTAYLRGVRAEMTRVVWPTRQEVINSSLVVVVTLIFFVFFTLIVDQVVVYALALVNQIGG